MTRHTVVIAPDSFKGTATAIEVTDALAEGWASARPGDILIRMPLADGGEGTLDAFEIAVPGAERVPVTVHGPDGRAVNASWIRLPDNSAVVELAETSGITLLSPLLPVDAHTIGFGQAIAAALDAGVERVYLAIGGSSSTDGGVGALTALGARFLDADDEPIANGGRGLADLASVNLGGLRQLPSGGAVILSDVTSELLGAEGAAAVFGPQKGATPSDVAALDAGLVRLAGLLSADPATPGAGAAGGTGFGMLAWGATLAAGANAVGEVVRAADAVASASIVVTGEGRFDGQSDAGKVPSYVRALAAAGSAQPMLVAGAISAEPVGFAATVSLTEIAGSSDAAMTDTLRWLRAAGERLARTL
ncbi:glycerate kinase [Mycetocola zhadangensis]|uniref:Glycerate kinase n=1 Tax=Mycetocola zhadangensis TaxID=1164595 RepID=A0A3L7IXA8_9MICO|nr:glycerate kinase [Mycetocola zhadangensis]RLQ82795.1 glycerate kinase [Mycetocola zhadangensis]GGE98056.1 glycerate kinase [Mycetocola zhadangensis]